MRALQNLPRPALVALVLALVALAAWIDYALSARGVALPFYYLVPIALAAWAAGWPLGAAATGLSALANFAIDWVLAAELNNPALVQVVSLLFFALVLGLVRVGSTLALMLKFYANSRQWRSQLPPSALAGNLMVVPASEANAPVPDVDGVPGPDYVPLIIEPGGAFGSGSHPTTRMCVALIEQYLPAGARVFDLGCGTGILSLAAARLGAASVLGADVDPEAIRAAKANARLNKLEDKVEFRLGTFDEVLVANAPTPNLQSPFDATLANILTDVLIDSLQLGLAHTVLSDGVLILSGIKTAERDRLVATLKDEQMEVVDEREEEGWKAVVARWKRV